jgi:hypothetical protein
MFRAMRVLPMVVLMASGAGSACEDASPAATLQAIAHDIEALGAKHAALREFSAARHYDTAALRIDYAWHTHQATHQGGWTAGVPNPDDDGVWFYIDVHAADSTLQIHTQPVVPAWCLGGKRVAFLMLEGAKAGALGAELQRILQAHGVVACQR